jgi:hypothetical protein
MCGIGQMLGLDAGDDQRAAAQQQAALAQQLADQVLKERKDAAAAAAAAAAGSPEAGQVAAEARMRKLMADSGPAALLSTAPPAPVSYRIAMGT